MIHASFLRSRACSPHQPRSPAPPVPFVLPGESLSKYGGKPAEDAPKSTAGTAAPSRPASTFKPATLIEAPLAWDGSGLLPGESLSKHRARQPEPAVEAEPGRAPPLPMRSKRKNSSPGALSPPQNPPLRQRIEPASEELLPEPEEDHLTQEESFEEDEFEETAETAPANQSTDDTEDYEIEPVIDEPSVEERFGNTGQAAG